MKFITPAGQVNWSEVSTLLGIVHEEQLRDILQFLYLTEARVSEATNEWLLEQATRASLGLDPVSPKLPPHETWCLDQADKACLNCPGSEEVLLIEKSLNDPEKEPVVRGKGWYCGLNSRGVRWARCGLYRENVKTAVEPPPTPDNPAQTGQGFFLGVIQK